jgi:hypothetical protein
VADPRAEREGRDGVAEDLFERDAEDNKQTKQNGCGIVTPDDEVLRHAGSFRIVSGRTFDIPQRNYNLSSVTITMSSERTLIASVAAAAAVGAGVAAAVSYVLSRSEAAKAAPPPRGLDEAALENKIRNAVLSQTSALREALPGPKVYPPVATPAVQVRPTRGAMFAGRRLWPRKCGSCRACSERRVAP